MSLKTLLLSVFQTLEEDDGVWPDMDDYDIIADVAGDGFQLEKYSS